MKLSILLSLFLTLPVFAYIPPTKVILEKTVENAGTTAYQIEKEIRFSNPEIPVLKETWYIENDRAMRLTVSPATGAGPRLTILYTGNAKTILISGSRTSTRILDEMSERFFHFHRTENFIQALSALHILTTTQGNLDLARLNRSQGVVNFGIGHPTDEGAKASSPYIWIDQDAFVIRKIRFNEDTELLANNYQIFPKGLNYPMITRLDWDQEKVKMTTLSVTMVKKFPPTVFQPTALEDSSAFLTSMSRWKPVSEFYSRFR